MFPTENRSCLLKSSKPRMLPVITARLIEVAAISALVPRTVSLAASFSVKSSICSWVKLCRMPIA